MIDKIQDNYKALRYALNKFTDNESKENFKYKLLDYAEKIDEKSKERDESFKFLIKEFA